MREAVGVILFAGTFACAALLWSYTLLPAFYTATPTSAVVRVVAVPIQQQQQQQRQRTRPATSINRTCTANHEAHRAGRMFWKHPVVVVSPGLGRDEREMAGCDVPCVFYNSESSALQKDRRPDAFMDRIPGGANAAGRKGDCDAQKSIMFSMESAVNYPILHRNQAKSAGYDILSTYDLDSDVPCPYFSWAEYDFRAKPQKKTGGAMMAVIISNCGSTNNRLKYLQELIDNGVTVHSFGKCMNNKNMPATKNSGYILAKNEIIAPYKFTAAFENSNTEWYVTEKLYGPLVAGSVPVHMGIANVHDVVPHHSVVSVHDFPSAKELTEYIKYLDRNDTAYGEYLQWKAQPYTAQFKSIIDISKVHSFCRLCIRVADLLRRDLGNEARPSDRPRDFDDATLSRADIVPLYVRERGFFYSVPLAFKLGGCLEDLKDAVLRLLRKPGDKGTSVVWRIYDRYDRSIAVATDEDVAALHGFRELEVVIVD